MCGIFGWQWLHNRVPNRDKRVVLATLLGDKNDNRGGKSWGWCAPPTPQREAVAISRGLALIVGQAPAMATYSSLMGHTRQPTTGSVCKENSHPFEIGNIIGAHNGMVSNWSELEDKYVDRKKFAVDSMHIFAHLNEGKDMRELQCYGAIEWVEKDKAPGSILLCKLTESGDLSIARTEHGIVWSSAESALKAAMEAAGLKIGEMVSVKKGHVIEVRDGEAWKTGREIEVSTYARTSYAATSGGGTYYDSSAYADWWENHRTKDNVTANDPDECENPMCGSPLDSGGNCCVMFDEKCSGSGKAQQSQATVTAITAGHGSELSQHPSCKDAMEDPVVKELNESRCELCKAGVERGVDWHSTMSGSAKVSQLCKGPDYNTTSLYIRTIRMFKMKSGTTEEGLRERFKMIKRSWGWVVMDDKKPWTLADFYRTLKSLECRFCHNLKVEGKSLCESCQAKRDANLLRVCGEEGCLAVPYQATDKFCSRHECADEGCTNQSSAVSIYCEACRTKRRGPTEEKQLTLPSGVVSPNAV
jgi:hypothetical protein